MKRIHLLNGLTLPFPPGIQDKLDMASALKGFRSPYFSWRKQETLYRAMLRLAPYMCAKVGLTHFTAEEAVGNTYLIIYAISQRDGRKRISDKRHRAGMRIRGDKAPEHFKSARKPVFTDWEDYVAWALGRLKLVIKDARRLQTAEEDRFKPEFLRPETDDPIARATPVRRYDRAM